MIFPNAMYQHRTARFHRKASTKIPKPKRQKVAPMLKSIHAMESCKTFEVAGELGDMKLKEAAGSVRDGGVETLTHQFHRGH